MLMATQETLGSRIKRLRRAAEMSQRDLATAARIKVGALRNWEQDIRQPKAEAIIAIARALDITPNEILLDVIIDSSDD